MIRTPLHTYPLYVLFVLLVLPLTYAAITTDTLPLDTAGDVIVTDILEEKLPVPIEEKPLPVDEKPIYEEPPILAEKPVPIDTTPVTKERVALVDTVRSVDVVQRVNSSSMFVGGTEYAPLEEGKVFVILATNGVPQNNATCLVEIFYHNNTEFIEYTVMDFLEDGIYYYDFIVPNATGVYPVEVLCTYQTILNHYNATSGLRELGAGSGALSNTFLTDGSYWNANENAGDLRRIQNVFNFSGVNISAGVPDYIAVQFVGKRPQQGADPASDIIRFSLYNYNLSKYVVVGNDFSYLATDTEKEYIIYSNLSQYVSPTGQMAVKINDTANTTFDGALTDLSIDRLNIHLNFKVANSSITQVGGGGELHVSRASNIIVNNPAPLFRIDQNTFLLIVCLVLIVLAFYTNNGTLFVLGGAFLIIYTFSMGADYDKWARIIFFGLGAFVAAIGIYRINSEL
jgi:hypothetical protein